MIKDELEKLTPLGDEQDSDIEDESLLPDDDSSYEDDDSSYEDDEEIYNDDEPVTEGHLVSDIAEYDRKIDLLRAYVGYYTEFDLEEMFDTDSLVEILTKYTYNQIRARLVNTKSNTLEADFDLGDIVEINKPVLRYNIYEHHLGVIIGKHLVFDDKDKNRSPIYHTQYDILVQSEQFIDGISYEIRREVARDLILKEHTIESIRDTMDEFASYHINVNV